VKAIPDEKPCAPPAHVRRGPAVAAARSGGEPAPRQAPRRAPGTRRAHGSRRRAPGRLGAAVLALGLLAAARAAEADGDLERTRRPVTEYEVKAGFLCNLASFCTWPPESFDGPDAPIVVGVLGEDPFGELLDRVAEGRRAAGRPFVVKRFAAPDGVEPCHVLFVSRSEKHRIDRALAPVRGRGVLVVGDSRGFLERGGVVNFAIRDSRVRLEIQVDEARRRRLALSAHLLKLARLVRDERREPGAAGGR